MNMTNRAAVNWLINLMSDIGKSQHGDLWHYEQTLAEIRELLEAQPERKRGEWIYDPTEQLGYRCSICKKGMCPFDFCPNCGADMRKEDSHE